MSTVLTKHAYRSSFQLIHQWELKWCRWSSSVKACKAWALSLSSQEKQLSFMAS